MPRLGSRRYNRRMADPISVFISYSHDATTRLRVRELVERLRGEGVNAIFDQMFEDEPPAQGWARWMQDEIESSKYVLVVATETYHRRFLGHEESGKGVGATWEGGIITQKLYDAQGKNLKFIPIFFEKDNVKYIPESLGSTTHYNLSTADGYDRLYFRITGQHGYIAPPLGTVRTRTPSGPPL